jgi:hypothetical protein
MLVYLLRYIYNFSINVFIRIAGVCSDFCRVVHKTKLFVAIMNIYLDGLETLLFLFVLLTLLDDKYVSIQIPPPRVYKILP